MNRRASRSFQSEAVSAPEKGIRDFQPACRYYGCVLTTFWRSLHGAEPFFSTAITRIGSCALWSSCLPGSKCLWCIVFTAWAGRAVLLPRCDGYVEKTTFKSLWTAIRTQSCIERCLKLRLSGLAVDSDRLPTPAEVSARHRWLYAHSARGEVRHRIELGYGLEVGRGWLPLIDQALTRIGAEVQRMGEVERGRFALLQIKEKYGELRVYKRGANEPIKQIIGEAVELSRRTCEECGAYGLLHAFGGYVQWFWTLCDKCACWRAAQRNLSMRVAHQKNGAN